MVKAKHSHFCGKYAKIYTLSTIDGGVFYVGCTTKSIKERLRLHINEAKISTSTKKCKYIRSVNYEISINLLDQKWVTGTSIRDVLLKANNLEYYYMRQYLEAGRVLCNIQQNPKKILTHA